MTAAFRLLLVVCSVLLSSTILSQSGFAFLGDGRLELSWSELSSLEDGTSVLSAKPRLSASGPMSAKDLVFVLIGPGAEQPIPLDMDHADGARSTKPAIEIPNLPPGLFELQLRTKSGAVVESWPLLVRAELATTAHLDFKASRITVDSIATEPFGNEEIWSPEELAVLPGFGTEMLDGLDTHESTRGMRVDGSGVEPRTRPELTSYLIDRGLVGAQSPLGQRSAAFSAADRWLLTRPTMASRVSLHGIVGSSGRAGGNGALGYRSNSRIVGPVDLQARVQWLKTDDAGPFAVADDALKHNELESIETNGFVQAHPFGNPLRVELYANGSSRDHFLQEFALDLPHSAREDRAHLNIAAGYDFRVLSQPFSVELGYQRDYVETGDGEDFDVFERYSRNTSLDETTEDGLYWAPDNLATSVDEGRQYDYYYRSLMTVLSMRAESRIRWAGADEASGTDPRSESASAVNASGDTGIGAGNPIHPLRVGAELHIPRWRLFEHLAPSQVVRAAESGFQMTRNFGYSLDGDDQDSRSGHEQREPSELALYGTQRIRLSSLEIEGGLRWQQFSSGQVPLADLALPIGDDDRLQVTSEETHSAIAPRLGIYAPLGRKTHLWIDGGRTIENPPFEALYYDDDLLILQASLASQGERFGREFIFGNPALLPESRWSGHAGLARELGPALSLRLSGHTAQTSDTWIARAVPVSNDRVAYYDNDGERRESGLHASTTWKAGGSSVLRVFYDLSRTETNVIEPGTLYRGILAPDEPVQNVASIQTALPANLWLEDGVDRGYFPSLLDRTHRFAASWITTISPAVFGFSPDALPPSRLAVVFRGASGRPYTATFVRKEGSITESTSPADLVSPLEINGERMPGTWQIDLGIAQPFLIFGRNAHARLEVRNLTNNENATEVYGATGEPDDDGWLASPEGQAEVTSRGDAYAEAYRARIDDPRHFDDGIAGRIAVTLDF